MLSPLVMLAESVTCSEGKLCDAVSDRSVSSLTISGTMDVRDFQFIADSLDVLLSIDLTGVEIKEYSCLANESFFGHRGTFRACAIPPTAFFGTAISEVRLPSTLVRIEDAAFAGCGKLQSIDLPSSVSYIGSSAFQSSALRTLYVDADTVCDHAFCGCQSLTEVQLGGKVSIIGDASFRGCESLTSVTIAGENCIKSIGDESFYGCGSLAAADFSACSNLTAVGSWAFANTALTAASLPAGVSTVSEGCFFGNQSLKSLSIPASVTEIDDYAFYYNAGVSSATIPSQVSYIGDNAFEGVPFVEVYAKPVTPPDLGEDVFRGLNSDAYRAKLFVAENSVNAYSNADQWRDFDIGVDASVADISADSGVSAWFVGSDLYVTVAAGITAAVVADEQGITTTWRSTSAQQITIDTASLSGHVYVLRATLADGSVRIIKLLRK